ncbi:MAG: hypothetical protein A2902_07575 [Elusimicrobia bacterium RIFCSPLOWO2_01_FULL_64_13]|nr:MAG: hypothetical protein A2636_00180 [Elusimicrobia bacterium RIFCSPHIGHO2_01_FULL_64_10]OGR94492.1 MAG: hypothetical protein A2902_07575 [Elusimicrobia bacterium RIFCSPLOWO2_01_FULL_64_13]
MSAFLIGASILSLDPAVHSQGKQPAEAVPTESQVETPSRIEPAEDESAAPAPEQGTAPSAPEPVPETVQQELPAETIVEEKPPAVPDGSSRHTVWIWQETRDSLWSLADRFYGDPWKWKKIYLANRNSILDPDLIFPKQEIVIPPADPAAQ